MGAFGLRERGGGVVVEIGVEESGILRKDEVKIIRRVQGDLEGFRSNFQDMAAVMPVRAEQVEVISGDIDRAGVGRREKAHERAGEIFKTEFRLMRGGIHETRSRLGFAGDPDMDEIKNPFDADGGEEVFRGTQRGQSGAEVLPAFHILEILLEIGAEAGGHPKWRGRGVRHRVQRAIRTGAVALAIEQHPLSIQIHKSAQAEIPVAPHIADRGGRLVNALNKRARCGDLENRVPLDIERLAEAGGDGLVEGFARAFDSLPQGIPDSGGNFAGERNQVWRARLDHGQFKTSAWTCFMSSMFAE
jgi:hypothetical protein